MKNNVTITDVAQLFADNGYILTDFGIAQYNVELNSFDYISNLEVMEIFTRIYPNFERRELNVKMITKHLPRVSEGDFHIYNLCSEIEKSDYEEASLKKEIKKILAVNDERKKEIPKRFSGHDHYKCTQFLINNNVFSDYDSLYQYKDGDFNSFGLFEIKKLLKPHLCNKLNDMDYFRLIHIGRVDLTKIDSIKTGIDIRNKINFLTGEDWQTYERIVDITVKAKKTQGVYENEYPIPME